MLTYLTNPEIPFTVYDIYGVEKMELFVGSFYVYSI